MSGFGITSGTNPVTGIIEEPRKAEGDLWFDRQRRPDVRKLAYKPKGKKADSGDIIEQLAQQYYADAMSGASAIGQQMGQSFNRRGLGNSPLAAGLQSQAMNQALGRAQSEVAKMRLGYAQHQDALQRQDQAQSDQMLYQLLSIIMSVGGKALDWRMDGGSFDLSQLLPSEVDLNYDYESGQALDDLAGLSGLDPIATVSDPTVFGRSHVQERFNNASK